jgi:hypothetical protein
VRDYIIVRYPESREVYVGNSVVGYTDEMISIESGKYIFHLGEPNNYKPPFVSVVVESTNALQPLVIEFSPLAS